MWLVGVYFFNVQGVEAAVDVNGTVIVHASAAIETLWVMVMLWTYVFWDVLTKWGEWRVLVRRGWGSIARAVLGTWTFVAMWHVRGTTPVVLADLALLALVLMFRATKLKNLAAHTASSWTLIGGLLTVWGALTVTAVSH